MKFRAQQYAQGIKELSSIHSEGGNSKLWEILQSQFKEVSVGFDLSSNLPLGKQAERYVSEMIQSSSRFELILENLQIIEDKRTVGELDFIIKDLEEKTFIHVELATKFYLEKENDWVGPNLKDRLDLKVEKYHAHQKKMLDNLIVKSTLSKLNIQDVKSQLLIIGQLYNRYGDEEKLIELNLNQTWISYTKFCQLSFVKDVLFNIPTKKDWIVCPSENQTWFTQDMVMIDLAISIESERSQLMWMKDDVGNYARFFVTWW